MSCYLCGAKATPSRCPGDGGDHRHGMVHLPGGGLEPVCPQHWRDVWELWNLALAVTPGVDLDRTFQEFASG